MTKYQKAAALAIRLVALALIIYTVIASIPAAFMMPQAVWVMLPSLIAGVTLHFCAIPLARIAASGIGD